MLKMTLDYEFQEEYSGSEFFFENWEECWELIQAISKNSYHNYFIEEYEKNRTENNEKE